MIFSFQNFELDTDKFELRRDGKAEQVEPQTIELLRYLIENRDKMTSRNDLVEAIWNNRAVSEWAVTAAIKAARKALDDTGEPRQFIRTIHGKGFRFVADVLVHGQFSKTSGATPLVQENQQKSLIVIPFDDLNEGDEQRYFADGITEDLITDLGKVSDLIIASRNTSYNIKSRNLDIQSIAGELGVSHVLEGSCRRQGDRLRINVQLLDAVTGAQIWADRFEGSGGDIFSMQDEINARIVRSLKLRLALEITPRGTSKIKAYDLCLRGRSEYYLYTPNHLAKALEFFEQATQIDPDYAEAYAYQAYCRTSNYVFAWPGSDPNLDQAVRLAQTAIALDEKSALAHTRLGWALGFINQPDQAIESFERAIDLDQENAEIWMAFGETMNRLAMPNKALPLLDKAFSIDNFVPPSWEFTRGHSHALLGQLSTALEHFSPVIERVPGFIPARVQLVRVYAEMGRIDEAKTNVAAIAKFAPRYKLMNAKRMFPYPQIEHRDRFEAALRLADFPI